MVIGIYKKASRNLWMKRRGLDKLLIDKKVLGYSLLSIRFHNLVFLGSSNILYQNLDIEAMSWAGWESGVTCRRCLRGHEELAGEEAREKDIT